MIHHHTPTATSPVSPQQRRSLKSWFRGLKPVEAISRLFVTRPPCRPYRPPPPLSPPTAAPEAPSAPHEITDPRVLRLLDLVQSCPQLDDGIGDSIRAEAATLAARVPERVLDEIRKCVALMQSDRMNPLELSTAADWLRQPGEKTELAKIEQIGVDAYVEQLSGKHIQGNVIGSYFKRLVQKVPGGLIIQPLRNLLMAVTALRENGSVLVPVDAMAIIRAVLTVTEEREEILRQVCALADTILKLSKVDSRNLAVVLPVTDLNAGRPLTVGDMAANSATISMCGKEFKAWNALWGIIMTRLDEFAPAELAEVAMAARSA
ncbi:hypothetical protein HDU96_010621 [Phlyctochytrium bullatum]|nr:hypothetical protein HDU96_010621 [Phlyctochytrium bullatum]